MKDFRSKLAVAAVIFGLGGLGGFAIASNPGHTERFPAAKIAAQTNQSGQPALIDGHERRRERPRPQRAGLAGCCPRQAVPGRRGRR